MRRLFLIACVLPLFAIARFAQAQPAQPADLADLPKEIKTLPWQSINLEAAQPLEFCRALLLLNHALDELSANATAEADLMSAYIETKKLGQEFAKAPPPSLPPGLSYANAEQVAIAMLRGPLSTSSYATDLSDLSLNTVSSYVQLYADTCARTWSEFDESRHLVRAMSAFLAKNKQLKDYDTWAIAESARREEAAKQRAAAVAKQDAAAAAASATDDATMRQQRIELFKMKAALAAAHTQLQQDQLKQQQANATQTASAQNAQGNQGGPPNQTVTPAGQPALAVPGGYVVDGSEGYGMFGGYSPYGGYGGYGYYGGYGDTISGGTSVGSDAARANAATAAQYHAGTSTWNHEPGYGSTARTDTESRMANFHGAPAAHH